MPSLARVLVVLGLAVLVVGGSAAGYGVYVSQSGPCVSGHGVSTNRLGANETPPSSFDRVPYGNLSATEQRMFRDAVEDGSPSAAGNGGSDGEENGTSGVVDNRSLVEGLDHRVVAYRDARYETVVWTSDCADRSVAFVVLGGVGAAVGAAVAGGSFGWRRLSNR